MLRMEEVALQFLGDSGECRGVVSWIFFDPYEAPSRAEAYDSRCPASHVGVEHHGTGWHVRLIHRPFHEVDRLLRRVQPFCVVAFQAVRIDYPAVQESLDYRLTSRRLATPATARGRRAFHHR